MQIELNRNRYGAWKKYKIDGVPITHSGIAFAVHLEPPFFDRFAVSEITTGTRVRGSYKENNSIGEAKKHLLQMCERATPDKIKTEIEKCRKTIPK